jgi:hypothetical protein
VADRELVLRPLPEVELRLTGDEQAARHFAAEYGRAEASEGEHARRPSDGGPSARLNLRFARRMSGEGGEDRHKSVSWRGRLLRVGDAELTLEVALKGYPRWFGLSLVQGFVVEPVLSLLAAERGVVLLPAAGIIRQDGVDLLIGQSRTGKSSLSMRALASGIPILGDDQVVVARDGECIRFPRRLRVYDDLSATAPAAFARLTAGERLQLALRRASRMVTGGRIAPSLAVPIERFGAPIPLSGRLRRVVLLTRTDAQIDLRAEPAGADMAVARALVALESQRQRLHTVIGEEWIDELKRTVDIEAPILGAAFGSVPILAVAVPGGGPSRETVARLSSALGLP